MNWRDPEFRRDLLILGSWKDKRVRRRLVIALLAVLFLVIFLAYWTGRPFGTNPALCGQFCHVTYGEYQSWTQSTHAEVPCHFCHLDSPLQKLVNPAVRFVKTQLDSFEKPVNADSQYSQEHIPKERCLRCHATDAPVRSRQKIPLPEGAMHEAHLAFEIPCTACHNRIAHSGAEAFEPIRSWAPEFEYQDFLNMREGCWRCHSTDGSWRNEETLKFVEGQVPPTECQTCHEATWALMPRDGVINHDDVKGVAWQSGERHGKEARKDFFVCLGCHDRYARAKGSKNPPDCSDACHGGIVMPHDIPKWSEFYEGVERVVVDQARWRLVHYKIAEAQGVKRAADGRAVDPKKTCSKCHRRGGQSENFCDDCHHRDFLNDTKEKITAKILASGSRWRTQHPTAVKNLGTDKCTECHAFEFCSGCHTSGVAP